VGTSKLLAKQRAVYDRASFLAVEDDTWHARAPCAERIVDGELAGLLVEPQHQHPALAVTGEDKAIVVAVGRKPMRHVVSVVEREPRGFHRFFRMADVEDDQSWQRASGLEPVMCPTTTGTPHVVIMDSAEPGKVKTCTQPMSIRIESAGVRCSARWHEWHRVRRLSSLSSPPRPR
jgi:hypothetical protein